MLRDGAMTEAKDKTRRDLDGTQAEAPLMGETLAGGQPAAGATGATAGSLPRQFGDYELLEELGRGGMGVVFKARQLSLDRIVAVKMILGGALASGTDVQRFYLEAKAAGRLSHPNIVTVYEIDELEGNPFYSMDYVEGPNLSELVRSGALASARAARYVKTIAAAIHVAHENGILHRDLKPQNVLIDRNDQPQITDFGLAKRIGDQSGLTATGTTVGTPSFMSPEQALGEHEAVTRASDVYSIGAILYVLLTGRPPFRNDTVLETLHDVIHKDPAAPRSVNPQADRDLETISLKCLQKSPAQRYQTAAELAADLDRYLLGEPILAKPVSRLTRVLRWVRHIPLIAAVAGGRNLQPTPWQKRANWALIMAPLVVCLVVVLGRVFLPARVRIATGASGGLYEQFGQEYARRLTQQLSRPVEVLTTGGSVENAQLLLRRRAELALMQEDTLASRDIAVAAPLYYDAVFVVVRRDAGIHGLADLAGKNVSLGPVGSGMRRTAERILETDHRGGVRELGKAQLPFTNLVSDPGLAAAIVTSGSRNAELRAVLTAGPFEVLALNASLVERLSLRYPALRAYTIRRGEVAAADGQHPACPPEDVRTVATATFLAVRRDATDRLVRLLLRTLYADETLGREFGLITAAEAAHWQEFALHPAAYRFFQGLDSGE